MTKQLQPNDDIIKEISGRFLAFRSRRSKGHESKEKANIVARLKSELDRYKFAYMNEEFQEKARAVIPVEELHEEAETLLKGSAGKGIEYQDALLYCLCRWYRDKFMTWINTAPCQFCQSETKSAGSATPTEEEVRYGGSRVELYQCTICQKYTRFPRYNHPLKLMETRSGRCGEWANLFTLFCVAMGFETRYVLDYTDHVWVEVYNEKQKRWVHCDPSEGEKSIDQPLMYEVGWKKNLTYIFAFGEYEVKDVIRRYSRDMHSTLSRRDLVPEDWLSTQIRDLTKMARSKLSEAEKVEFLQRDEAEHQELMKPVKRPLGLSELSGRKSGSADWRQSRGEAAVFNVTKGPSIFSLNEHRMQLIGHSSLESGNLILTEDRCDQVGAAWTPFLVELDKPLIFQFKLRIHSQTGGNSADGMAFVIQCQGPASIGSPGAGLGYAGITKSLAIEFDTYQGKDTCNDPSDNHISIHTRGTLPNSAHHNFSIACTSELPLLSNQALTVSIVYKPKQSLEVWLSDNAGNKEEYVRVLEAHLDLQEKLCDNKAYIGFTASTGGLCQQHSITEFGIFEARF